MPTILRPVGLIVCLVPAILLVSIALLADVAKGGDFVDQWGAGQTVLMVAGFCFGLIGFLLHRKAVNDEQRMVRSYARTIIFILVPFVFLIAIPFAAAEWLARRFPRVRPLPSAYQQTDPVLGFSLIPDRHYRIVSVAKDFDIEVNVDSNGFRVGDDGETDLSADIPAAVLLGDSHAFGFGVASNDTLAEKLTDQLESGGHSINVVNAGVPGFGPGQCLLRMRSMDDLPAGTVIVFWINPLNDLVNLSMAVDYHFPKPHAVLVRNSSDKQQVVFRPAGIVTNDIGFQFSEPFDSLNDRFGLQNPSFWQHCELLDRISAVADKPPIAKDGVIQLIDSTSAEQYLVDDSLRIAEQPLLYASRYWPEMSDFPAQRRILEDLAGAVMREANELASERGWRLIALIAPEGHQHQSYAQSFMEKVELASNIGPIAPGWSYQTTLRVLETNQIPTVDGNEGIDGQVDEWFLQNDDHTSPAGHERLATMLADRLRGLDWLPQKTSK